VKAAVLAFKLELLDSLDKPPSQKDRDKVGEYAAQQKEIKDKADEMEKSSDKHLHAHVVFARAATLFQVAIAVTAISVLTHKKRFWFVGLAFGVIGLVFLIQGFLF
jgi:Domain of unknown function (DUF4337)